eukprot:CAMPEP_0176018716 /NCGR_PEP_ID=MMETSP0120_2-20121206/9021_1 /TAXON_ID=160619 /ORGANISM="Kryptoperidinium foliaceum, Strain CCMP 1326" /LENGTH=112 /DNA_ID=CAMNT_0017351775 /DNA_START=100 /DNA_END=438 /DNA_ORIENTATION=+
MKTDSSISTATLSVDSQGTPDVAPPGGTPMSKLFRCCLPKKESAEETSDENENDQFEDIPRELSPIIETTPLSEDQESTNEEQAPMFDTGLICQMAVLGGVLAGQALNLLPV